MRIKPGDQARKTGTAHAAGDKPARKRKALSRKLVDVRRLKVRMPHEAIVSGSLIVGNDEDDIGFGRWLGRIGSAKRPQRREQQGKDEQVFHGDTECPSPARMARR